MTRRDLVKLLLASAVAEAVDVEQLLWTPKPIVTVPAMPVFGTDFGWNEIRFSGLFQIRDDKYMRLIEGRWTERDTLHG